MAETEYTFEQLKKQNHILRKENDELNSINKKSSAQLDDVLKYSEMTVITTTDELRVISHYGSDDAVFGDAAKNLKSGADLFKIVLKATKNVYDKDGDAEDEDIEKKVHKFVTGYKDETEFKIIGKNDDEIFMLIWDIKKKDDHLKHFFRVIPTNNIVEESKKFFIKQFEEQKELIKQILNSISDGVVFIDLSNKIKIANEPAKDYLLVQTSKLMSRAVLEGRFFHEIFANEEQDKITQRLEINNRVVINRKKINYVMKTHGKKLNFSVIPWTNEENNVLGVIVIVSYHKIKKNEDAEEKQVDISTIKNALKNSLEQNKIMKERIKELEYNHNWFMNQRNDDQKTIRYYHSTIKNLYTYLDMLPSPFAILKLPGREYDFVNKAFLDNFKLDKKDVLSKKDKDVFGPDAESLLDSVYFKNKNNKEVVKFKNVRFRGRQIILFDNEGNQTHLIRVFE